MTYFEFEQPTAGDLNFVRFVFQPKQLTTKELKNG